MLLFSMDSVFWSIIPPGLGSSGRMVGCMKFPAAVDHGPPNPRMKIDQLVRKLMHE